MNTVLRSAIITGIFLIPFICLLISRSFFFPFITGKNFTFRIIVEIIFALWAILALRDSTARPKFSYILASFASFVAIIALANIFGENPSRSFWSNFERMEGFITLLHVFALFVVMGSTLLTNQLWTRLFQTSLFVSLIVCFYSFLQLAGLITINQGGVRVDATFGNATYLAIYLVFHIFIALVLLLRTNSKIFQKIIYGTIILLQVIVLYHTATRGAILGLLGGLTLSALIIAFFEKERASLKRASIALLGGILILVSIFFAVRNTDFVKNSPVLARFATLSLNENKTQARGYVWPMAVSGFKEKPLLGWGQENFNYVFNKYYNPEMFRHEPWFDRTHNVFLDWLIAGGILGLLGYLSLFAFSIFAIWRKADLSLPERAVFTGLFAAYLFYNIFTFDNITSYIMFMIVLGYLHFDTAKTFKNEISKKISYWLRDSEMMTRLVLPVIVVVAIFGLYYLNIKPITANKALISAIANTPQVTLNQHLDFFKKALNTATLGQQEAREQMIQVAFGLRSAQNAELKDKQAFYDFTKSQYEKMIAEAPNDVRHHFFMGMLLNVYGEYDEALKYLEKARELSPGKQAILFEISSTNVNKKDYAAALLAAKKAYDLEPSYEGARIVYAVTAIYAGRNKLAEEVLTEGFGTPYYADDRLLRAYFDTGQFNRIVELWQSKVKENPSVARMRAALGAAYSKVGRTTEALAELKKAYDLETDPETKAQYQQLIIDVRAGKTVF